MKDERSAPSPPERICEGLGELIVATVRDEQPAPASQQWAAIEQGLESRRARRWRLLPALAATALVLVGTGMWLVARRPLGYRAEGCTLAADGALTATGAGAVGFTDGSKIQLADGTRMQVKSLPYSRGAEIVLDDGEATLSVVRRSITHWTVLAGPFHVEVTGTRFSVRWSKQRGQFRIAMQEGEVHVSGGRLAGDAVLRAGQVLTSDVGEPPPAEPVDDSNTLPAPPVPSAAPPAEPPRPAAHTRKRSEVTAPRPSTSGEATVHRAPPSTEPPESPSLFQTPPAPAPIAPAPSPLPPLEEPSSPPPPAPAVPGPRRITIHGDGSLANGMAGFAWVSAAQGTRLSSPPIPPVPNSYGRLPAKDGRLCVSGTMPALRCVNEGLPQVRCNWKSNWGVQIGFHVTPDGTAWGEQAASAIAVDFQRRSNHYRLNAHRHGDPDDRLYCIADYQPGQTAKPSMFKTKCWDDEGDTLPDFKGVDAFNLMLPSGMEYAAFRYCINGIEVFP